MKEPLTLEKIMDCPDLFALRGEGDVSTPILSHVKQTENIEEVLLSQLEFLKHLEDNILLSKENYYKFPFQVLSFDWFYQNKDRWEKNGVDFSLFHTLSLFDLAMSQKELGVIQFLVRCNAISHQNDTIEANLAVKLRQWDKLILALEKNPNALNVKDFMGKTLIHYLLDNKDLNIAKFIINNYPVNEGQIAVYAAIKKQWDFVDFLVKKNPKTALFKVKENGLLIHYAAREERWDLVKLILEKNPQIITAMREEDNILKKAIYSDQWDLIESIIAERPGIASYRFDGKLLLDHAISAQTVSTVNKISEATLNLAFKENNSSKAKGVLVRIVKQDLQITANASDAYAYYEDIITKSQKPDTIAEDKQITEVLQKGLNKLLEYYPVAISSELYKIIDRAKYTYEKGYGVSVFSLKNLIYSLKNIDSKRMKFNPSDSHYSINSKTYYLAEFVDFIVDDLEQILINKAPSPARDGLGSQ